MVSCLITSAASETASNTFLELFYYGIPDTIGYINPYSLLYAFIAYIGTSAYFDAFITF